MKIGDRVQIILALLGLSLGLAIIVYGFPRWIDLHDFARAFNDVRVEFMITFMLLIVLIGFGETLRRHSLYKQNQEQQKSHPIVTTEIWIQKQREKQQPKHGEKQWWIDFWQGISTEMFGAVVTAFFLGMIVLIFQQYQAIQNRQTELILQMGSPDNAIAVEAVRILSFEGWLYDGTLSGSSLRDANLQSANLRDANLQNTNLRNANLQNANLRNANLSTVDLIRANLQSANLRDTNLQNANLRNANLQNANMLGTNLQNATLFEANPQNADLGSVNLMGTTWYQANLQGVSLRHANLQGALMYEANLQNAELREVNLQNAVLISGNLRGAILYRVNLLGTSLNNVTFDGTTVLPDSQAIIDDNNVIIAYEKYWTPETDMSRYTDPNHPDFWNPCIELEQLPWYCE